MLTQGLPLLLEQHFPVGFSNRSIHRELRKTGEGHVSASNVLQSEPLCLQPPLGRRSKRTTGLVCLFVCLFHAGKVNGQNYKGMISGDWGFGHASVSSTRHAETVRPIRIKVLPFRREPVGPKNWSLLSALSFLVVGIESGLQEEEYLTGGSYT